MQSEGGSEKQLRSEAENEAFCGGMRDGHHYLQQQKNSLAHSIEIRAQFTRGNQKHLLTICRAYRGCCFIEQRVKYICYFLF